MNVKRYENWSAYGMYIAMWDERTPRVQSWYSCYTASITILHTLFTQQWLHAKAHHLLKNWDQTLVRLVGVKPGYEVWKQNGSTRNRVTHILLGASPDRRALSCSMCFHHTHNQACIKTAINTMSSCANCSLAEVTTRTKMAPCMGDKTHTVHLLQAVFWRRDPQWAKTALPYVKTSSPCMKGASLGGKRAP